MGLHIFSTGFRDFTVFKTGANYRGFPKIVHQNMYVSVAASIVGSVHFYAKLAFGVTKNATSSALDRGGGGGG